MTDQVVLAFDFGTRRIGVAIGNSVTRRANALQVIDTPRQESRWRAIGCLVDGWRPHHFVVGVPRRADGSELEMTVRCERFARQLAGRFGLPVACVNEAFSSAVVEGRKAADAHAAAVILQQWFDEAEVAAPPAGSTLPTAAGTAHGAREGAS